MALRVGVAVLVLLVFVLPVFSTLQPGYYARYPGMRARMQAWRDSTHGLMPCTGCHVDPGPVSYLVFAARSIPAFYSQLLQGPRRTNLLSVPGRKACQKCHTSYRQVSPAGDLLIPHRAHVEVLKIECVVCHKDLVHAPTAAGFNKPRMTTCVGLCHDGKKATAVCVKCHTRKQTPDSHMRPDWLEIHSTMTEKINCGRCHGWSPDYCQKCHSVRPKTHKGNWKKLHQTRAKQRGKGCLFCHREVTFCKQCHD